MEVVFEDGSISSNLNTVLEKWKCDFKSQITVAESESNAASDSSHQLFNEFISIFEVKKAIGKSKNGKACEEDVIPSET